MSFLILASTSPYRRAVLERLGLPFEVAAPPYEEGPVPGLTPAELAEAHARGKALSLAGSPAGALVIGSDQVAALDGDVLPKPGSASRAREQLLRLEGRTHLLATAVAVHECATGRTLLARVDTHVTLRRLSGAAIDRYLAAEQPYDCAGCYRSEGRGITILEAVEGPDPTAVIGLPLIALGRLLREFGLDPWEPAARR